MKEKISEDLIEKGLALIEAEKNKELVKYLFQEYLNQPLLLKKLNPERYKKYEEHLNSLTGNRKNKIFRGSGNSNKITEAINVWNRCNFLEFDTKMQKRQGKGGSEYE